ncbi:thiaminase II [Halobacillus litoralis]|uniref:thiaminase II n=1 Tax=Halobacillus litoralis TaxID=45668 RepID=UPI001CD6BA4B|nr:thiaminase II [Halobacillus litoralis]MCA0969433.1 thiaminase II [Halobacillus litoralis]
MSFTKQLRKENHDVFHAIFQHPFVEGIGEGELNPKAVAHYIKADFEYLNAFMHVYGLAINKTDNRQDIHFFNEQIKFILDGEIHPHQNLCEYIGIPYSELQGYPLPPTADHYIKHMYAHGYQGSLGETIAALLPCPWTYLEIARNLLERYHLEERHPFYRWIIFYSGDEMDDITGYLKKRLDEIAECATDSELQKMRDAFRKSCLLEWSFWEMAHTCEDWPIGKVGVIR